MSEAYTIGTSSRCSLQVTDATVDVIHCAIRIDDGGRFFIRDVSPKGTWIRRATNTARVNGWTEIFIGDIIYVGNTEIPFGVGI